jgi:hypothetical protein
MVEGAVSIVTRCPTAANTFSVGDLLVMLSAKEVEEGYEPGTVVGALVNLL